MRHPPNAGSSRGSASASGSMGLASMTNGGAPWASLAPLQGEEDDLLECKKERCEKDQANQRPSEVWRRVEKAVSAEKSSALYLPINGGPPAMPRRWIASAFRLLEALPPGRDNMKDSRGPPAAACSRRT
jgi:hypothetical protein